MADIDSVGTAVTEGDSFYQRNAGGLGHAAASIGGLFWGLLAAVAECPHCPGSFRCPIGGDEHTDFWRCPRCGGVWAWKRDEQGTKGGENR